MEAVPMDWSGVTWRQYLLTGAVWHGVSTYELAWCMYCAPVQDDGWRGVCIVSQYKMTADVVYVLCPSTRWRLTWCMYCVPVQDDGWCGVCIVSQYKMTADVVYVLCPSTRWRLTWCKYCVPVQDDGWPAVCILWIILSKYLKVNRQQPSFQEWLCVQSLSPLINFSSNYRVQIFYSLWTL